MKYDQFSEIPYRAIHFWSREFLKFRDIKQSIWSIRSNERSEVLICYKYLVETQEFAK